MRITLTIDDDVLAAAKEMAAIERKSVGETISAMARTGLKCCAANRATRNGVPLLQMRPGAPRATSVLVHQLREELP